MIFRIKALKLDTSADREPACQTVKKHRSIFVKLLKDDFFHNSLVCLQQPSFARYLTSQASWFT